MATVARTATVMTTAIRVISQFGIPFPFFLEEGLFTAPSILSFLIRFDFPMSRLHLCLDFVRAAGFFRSRTRHMVYYTIIT